MEKLKALYNKYQELILYIVFGALTTILSYIVLWLFTSVWVITPDSTVIANIISNLAGVIFAYFTNRGMVFHSTEAMRSGRLKEFGRFFIGRGFTIALDLAIVFVFADLLKFNVSIVKIVAIVIVVVLNYVISKLIVFRKNADEKKNGAK
ncbi:MAG: GtrA family protein [Eubacteriales bacterium]|nr:GtrA family protein [Eubacteriales bacterium]MDD3881562.1 GtrA family protein [Eubacteriales bacterium]MDD4513368.1 GtrA family protein [Eubacteriales bacterium]